MRNTEILFDNVTKEFGDLKVIENFSLTFPKYGIVSFIGPSGCGKTTILNLLAKIIKPNKGKVIGIEDKKISFSFQENYLLPWCTVLENVSIVLKDKYIAKKILCDMKLGEFLNKKPHELSGGMKKRVDLARALVYDGEILLLDEPFNGIDTSLKSDICNLITNGKNKKLIIMVTHNVTDALKLSDKIFIIKNKPISFVDEIDVNLSNEERNTKDKNFIELKNKLSNML